MNIVMMTNTYKPFVGGVPRSVETFMEEYRKRGHRVLIVAPEFENMAENEKDILRVPAIQNFNGSDFSLPISTGGVLAEKIEKFQPDIIHSHHPYLIGDMAFRIASKLHVPLIFTYHTQYEKYTHYVPADSDALKRFVIALSVGYANLCDYVFAPSGSLADIIRDRGVESPIEIIPTGVDIDFYKSGNRKKFRNEREINNNSFVIGFVSRLAPEKNTDFLAHAVSSFVKKQSNSHFMLVGDGPSEFTIQKIFKENGLENRLHVLGTLSGRELVDAYHAMDVFVFASKTETQGMVVSEAMAAGIPVIALDANGVREIVSDHYNGRLLKQENEKKFVNALMWYLMLDEHEKDTLKKNALKTAMEFSKEKCADHAIEIYKSLLNRKATLGEKDSSLWEETKVFIKTEMDLLKNIATAAEGAINKSFDTNNVDTDSKLS